MKLNDVHLKAPFEDFYYIMLSCPDRYEYVDDVNISHLLNIEQKKYQRILRKNGAYKKDGVGYLFHNREDCLRAIFQLEPYVIMSTLTEE